MRSMSFDHDSLQQQNQKKIERIENKSQTHQDKTPNILFKSNNNIFDSLMNQIEATKNGNISAKFNQNTKTILMQINKKEFDNDFEEGNGNIKAEEETDKLNTNSPALYELNQHKFQMLQKKSQLSQVSPSTSLGQNFSSQYQTHDTNKKDDLELVDIAISNNLLSPVKPNILEFKIEKNEPQNQLGNQNIIKILIFYLNQILQIQIQ